MAIRFEDKSIPKRSGKTGVAPAETAKQPGVEGKEPLAASAPAGELSLGQPEPAVKPKGKRRGF